MSNSPLVSYTRISPNRNSERNHKIDTISIHCVVGQLTVEQIGGAGQNGIINVMLGTDSKTRKDVTNQDVYPLTIRGETKKPAELAATTGDVIHVEPNTGHSMSYVMKGSTVKWTLSYTKTIAVIASGEFLVQ